MDLTGKTALVTGAGRGIGRACAVRLAELGAEVVANDRRGSPDLEETAEEIRGAGGACHTAPADAHSREGCQQMFDRALAAAARVDILVSNPAYSRRGAFLDYTPEEFDRTIQGTLAGGFHIGQLAARQMVRQGGGGKIVFISSVQAEIPQSHCFAYGAAKAGLNHMTRSIAVELFEHRINVNAIEPGWIDTPGERATFSDEVIRETGQQLPWGRLGQPREIAHAAAFLCSDEADYVTGSVLVVDGGYRFKDCRAASVPRWNE